jgi:hypothetical protein
LVTGNGVLEIDSMVDVTPVFSSKPNLTNSWEKAL